MTDGCENHNQAPEKSVVKGGALAKLQISHTQWSDPTTGLACLLQLLDPGYVLSKEESSVMQESPGSSGHAETPVVCQNEHGLWNLLKAE